MHTICVCAAHLHVCLVHMKSVVKLLVASLRLSFPPFLHRLSLLSLCVSLFPGGSGGFLALFCEVFIFCVGRSSCFCSWLQQIDFKYFVHWIYLCVLCQRVGVRTHSQAGVKDLWQPTVSWSVGRLVGRGNVNTILLLSRFILLAVK